MCIRDSFYTRCQLFSFTWHIGWVIGFDTIIWCYFCNDTCCYRWLFSVGLGYELFNFPSYLSDHSSSRWECSIPALDWKRSKSPSSFNCIGNTYFWRYLGILGSFIGGPISYCNKSSDKVLACS